MHPVDSASPETPSEPNAFDAALAGHTARPANGQRPPLPRHPPAYLRTELDQCCSGWSAVGCTAGEHRSRGVAGIDLSQFFGGELRRRLMVVLRDGTDALFVVIGAACKAAVITTADGPDGWATCPLLHPPTRLDRHRREPGVRARPRAGCGGASWISSRAPSHSHAAALPLLSYRYCGRKAADRDAQMIDGGIAMTDGLIPVDYRKWDWLPQAAVEIEAYLQRLLTEAGIEAHSVGARAKSISSFHDKCTDKGYTDPLQQVTDSVAVRIITYSVTDRERAEELIRDRFEILPDEDRNPGETKPKDRRGYDCQHFVIRGERPDAPQGWLSHGGKLPTYFATFGGLEIQVRTVAAHAWAEFEHARRYKGAQYLEISGQDQGTIDQLFGAASDARSALDETFVAIERVLANPTPSTPPTAPADDDADDQDTDETGIVGDALGESTGVDTSSLRTYLVERFPEDEEATESGMEFACQLVAACDLDSIEALSAALDSIEADQVRRLMDITISVTRVRRLDDELLARFGERYIQLTGALGNMTKRKQQLEWRYDRLRHKVSIVGYNAYAFSGQDCPPDLEDVLISAARSVRELTRIVAQAVGADDVSIPDAVARSVEDLPASTRPKAVELADGTSLWVATNLNRAYSESLMTQLLQAADGLDLRVTKDGQVVASTN